ncbi:hypothetical protein [Glaciimonas sp. PAMC28666]|uniref:hypothetical protein n=1 Tax=Glaciimonas sp. PAMC28666 TaxID=2807626 RepID=UPI0019627738|nr:hypothetical protein [Glaciimonas sp. PAMC28666]QRX81046.1 hypothetical protein JQN73_12585 [Glaciimonas sp. PAMC28666]
MLCKNNASSIASFLLQRLAFEHDQTPPDGEKDGESASAELLQCYPFQTLAWNVGAIRPGMENAYRHQRSGDPAKFVAPQ